MSPEAQRIAIAEACGWVRTIRYGGQFFSLGGVGGPIKHTTELPDYLSDLNAMHEAEGVLGEATRHFYLCKLERLLGFSSGPGGWDMDGESLWAMVKATPAQRAEALLRALGKWEESA